MKQINRGRPMNRVGLLLLSMGKQPTPRQHLIRGSKRWAEKMAAKQILEQIESHQDAFLAGDSVETPETHEQSTEISSPELLYAPTELVTTALGIANHRLSGQQRGTRYRDSVESKQSNQAFAQNLADLTMQIVREVANAAKASGVTFGDTSSQLEADE